ncbi:MAG TPA: hypothetical protein VK856_04540 [Anaerolineaceae bacterium]|nr:hypothetical protein [Anaerolineaceae bacterium]
MKNQYSEFPELNIAWSRLFLFGGIAALLAGIVFRRNLGVEIALFSQISPPINPKDWLLLLQTNRLLGLAYLGIFDLVNVTLVGLMLLSLYLALNPVQIRTTLIALVLGLLGVAVYLSSNTAISILSLSNQYAISSSETQREILLPAATALLSLNRFSSPGAFPGSGGYVSMFLIAIAGLIFSVTLLKNSHFGRWSAFMGIIANSLDLMYCLVFPFSPITVHEKLALFFIPAAGFFLMVWHILVGLRLIHIARKTSKQQ